MPANYVLLEKVVVGAAGAASVTFNSIPQSGYTDLVMKVSSRSARAATGTDWKIEFNGSTTGYSYRRIYGDGAAVYSDTASTGQSFTDSSANSTASTFGNAEIYIPNYTSSNYKSWSADSVSENNASGANSAYQNLYADLWSNTASITSIEIKPVQSTTFAQYSTFSLYGVAALGTTPVIAPKATGGDIIDYDGTYWIHTFLSSGTFTPATALSCDYLVVAGGGGGGVSAGGGGGAGGAKTASGFAVTAGSPITVTVGAGGAGGNVFNPSFGYDGSSSSFSSISCTGGGGGGAERSGQTDGKAGGSGGGGGARNPSGYSGIGGTGVSGEGNNGGNGRYQQANGGGGGGQSAAGSIAGSSEAGNGGAGLTSSISGSSVGYAGGGGGGAVTGTRGTGTQGGGNGSSSGGTAGSNGTVNRGGGGGGRATNDTGYAGGSGIVIVRYLAA
jgi:hypothetical protein